jgi:hypothetical protein
MDDRKLLACSVLSVRGLSRRYRFITIVGRLFRLSALRSRQINMVVRSRTHLAATQCPSQSTHRSLQLKFRTGYRSGTYDHSGGKKLTLG